MRIGELARKVGVSCDTLRLYERQGLIQSDRRPNGYRDFPDPMLEVVQLIRQAQRLGFTLGEIGQLMQGIQGALDQDQVAEVLREKL
ncbi:MerR family transcriptional regulator, partial [Pseudophaeobacter sp.]|uniref:MerR family transcriptional regulator n=1 Tax=Pseudophaeobacter sp. TaxID=1971739 RepID=UPI003297909D